MLPRIKFNPFCVSKTTVLSIVASMISFLIICFSSSKNDTYIMVKFLPVVFVIALFFSGKSFKSVTNSVVSLTIFIGYFIKMVVQPMLFALGGYKSFFVNPSNSFENINKAFVLMSLENIFVFLGVNIFYREDACTKKNNIDLFGYNWFFLALILALIFFFLIISYFFVPAINQSYMLLFDASLERFARIHSDPELLAPRGTYIRYIYTLFIFLWPVVRISFAPLLMVSIRKKMGESFASLLLSILCLAVPILFLGEDNVGPFIGIVIGVCTLTKLYGKKSTPFVFLIMFLALIAGLFIISTKLLSFQDWRGATGIASVAQIINAYFPGIDNYAMCFSIQDSNRLTTLFYDLYYCIPFKETLFGLKGNNLNDLFTVYSETSSQIIPWGYQWAHYLSMFCSPIISFLFCGLAYKNESVANSTGDFWLFFRKTSLAFMISVSFSCYWASTLLRFIINLYLPLLVIIIAGNRKCSSIKYSNQKDTKKLLVF